MENYLFRLKKQTNDGNVHRLSKVYPMRNTLENKRVEYIDGEIPLVEVRWFWLMVTVNQNMI